MLALALALILTSVVYFLVMTLVDLYPYNNVRDAQRAEQHKEVATNTPPMLLPALVLGAGAVFSLPLLGYVAGGLEVLAAASGILLWWLPYLTGYTVPWATAGTGVTWAQLHARTYAHTVIVLPRIGERPRPNLEHIVLHALFVAAAVATFAATPAL